MCALMRDHLPTGVGVGGGGDLGDTCVAYMGLPEHTDL